MKNTKDGEKIMDRELFLAAQLLPQPYRQCILASPDPVEDIRLRLGRPLGITVGTYEKQFTSVPPVDENALLDTLEKAAQSSVYSVQDSLRRGYITARHGIRIGVCGTGISKNSVLSALTDISSLAIRVARQHCGISDGLIPLENGLPVPGILIAAPPGYGKTSLLRDMVRNLSCRGFRIAVADERGEIAAMHGAAPGFDVGPRTDVMNAVGKKEAVMMLLKTMSPQVIAMDEISAREDVEAAVEAAGNGVPLIATVHGRDENDIFSKPLLGALLENRVFRYMIVIEMGRNGRIYRVSDLAGHGSYAA